MQVRSAARKRFQHGQSFFCHEAPDEQRDPGFNGKAERGADGAPGRNIPRMENRRIDAVIEQQEIPVRGLAEQVTPHAIADENQPVGSMEHRFRYQAIGNSHQPPHDRIGELYAGDVLNQHDRFAMQLAKEHGKHGGKIQRVVNDHDIAIVNRAPKIANRARTGYGHWQPHPRLKEVGTTKREGIDVCGCGISGAGGPDRVMTAR